MHMSVFWGCKGRLASAGPMKSNSRNYIPPRFLFLSDSEGREVTEWQLLNTRRKGYWVVPSFKPLCGIPGCSGRGGQDWQLPDKRISACTLLLFTASSFERNRRPWLSSWQSWTQPPLACLVLQPPLHNSYCLGKTKFTQPPAVAALRV